MNIFHLLMTFFTKNRKNILFGSFFVILFFVLGDFALANDADAGTNNASNATRLVLEAMNGILAIAAAFLGLLTFLVGFFLYPDWTSGNFVGLNGGDNPPLKAIWIMVSNIVYFVFAFIFIWIALMNIVGKEDGYQLKESIPRFMLGVLMVPFTWFFVQFIISLSSILTVGVLSLPYDTFKDSYFKAEELRKITFCREYEITTGELKQGNEPIQCKDKNNVITAEEILSGKNSESLFGIMTIYTYGVMGLDANGILNAKTLGEGVKNLGNLTVKIVIDILFVVIYTLLMIALALALFARGVYLWVYAMFSPTFGLLFFFKKQKEGVMDGKFSITEFISLALVPVYVSGALAFGLIFLFVAGGGSGAKTNSQQFNEAISDGGTKIEFGGITYTIKGPSPAGGAVKQEDSKLIGEAFQGPIGTLILQLFGLAILWMAVMTALKASKVTANITEPFKQFGESIGGLISKAPLHAPILPGGMSIEGASVASRNTVASIENQSRSSGTEFQKKMEQALGVKKDDAQRMLDEARTIGSTVRGNIDRMIPHIEANTKQIDYIKAKTDETHRNAIINYYKDMYGVSLEKDDFINGQAFANAIDREKRKDSSFASALQGAGLKTSDDVLKMYNQTEGNTFGGSTPGGKTNNNSINDLTSPKIAVTEIPKDNMHITIKGKDTSPNSDYSKQNITIKIADDGKGGISNIGNIKQMFEDAGYTDKDEIEKKLKDLNIDTKYITQIIDSIFPKP